MIPDSHRVAGCWAESHVTLISRDPETLGTAKLVTVESRDTVEASGTVQHLPKEPNLPVDKIFGMMLPW